MICSAWLDRPLSVAGRVLVRQDGGRICTRLLDFKRDLALIPNVAIHMNREVNDGFKFNKQVDLLPLFAGGEKGTLLGLAAKELGVEESEILGSDLYLYNRDRASVWGCNEEFVSSGRLDDQQCAFTALKGFLAAKNSRSVNVMACFDNEEVGSGTKQGAASTFLPDTLKRINMALGKSEEAYLRALASSFMLSADNAHAVHPNHPEYADATHRPAMNGGPVIKHGVRYATDGVSQAVFTALCQKAGVPVQHFANRSDLPGGGTLGLISGSQVPIPTVDIGLAQLAMHSPYETAGREDLRHMVDGMTAFYNSVFSWDGNSCTLR